EAARDAGWSILDSAVCARDARTYQAFIVASRGEFSVAKGTYVKARTGWFSCRSSCYLAAGPPAVTQGTALAGLFARGAGAVGFFRRGECCRRASASGCRSKAARKGSA